MESSSSPDDFENDGVAEGWEEKYLSVLDNPETFFVDSAARYEPKGTYSYAVLEATGDNSPELLLRVESQEFNPILVFTIDDTNGDLIQVGGVLMDGAAGAGGQRLHVRGSRAGSGLYQIGHHSISEDAHSTLYGISGGVLSSIGVPVHFMLANPPSDQHGIEWINTKDSSGIRNVQREGNASVWGQSDIKSHDPEEDSSGGDTEGIELSGVVKEFTAEELMKGVETPNGEPENERHIVLVLDQPTEVTAKMAAPEPGTATIPELSLTSEVDEDYYEWTNLIDKRISITVTTENLWFPSDSSLPMGMTRLYKYESLEVE